MIHMTLHSQTRSLRLLWLPLLFVSFSLGQASPASNATAPAPKPQRAPAPVVKQQVRAADPAGASVSPETPVITIDGLCNSASRSKATAAAAKSAPCRTVITRAEFDAIASAVQADMDPATKRQFATFYPRLLLLQREFQKQGLQKNPATQRALAFARLRAEAEETAKVLKDKTANASTEAIDSYYASHTSSFETVDLQRLYVPAQKRDDQGKELKDAATAQEMKNKADELHTRAVAGEDFQKLQSEAYQMAGITGKQPPVGIGKFSADDLPADQRKLMDLKEGEVSQVNVELPNGFYIFKVVGRGMKSRDEVQDAIKAALAKEQFSAAMSAIENSASISINQAYFPDSKATGSRLPSGDENGAYVRRAVPAQAEATTPKE